jgi:DNA-binding MarR family transcriptional regulator
MSNSDDSVEQDYDSKILKILYEYYKNHRGDHEMTINDLIERSRAKLDIVRTSIIQLEERGWVESELTRPADMGLIKLTSKGIKIVESSLNSKVIKETDSLEHIQNSVDLNKTSLISSANNYKSIVRFSEPRNNHGTIQSKLQQKQCYTEQEFTSNSSQYNLYYSDFNIVGILQIISNNQPNIPVSFRTDKEFFEAFDKYIVQAMQRICVMRKLNYLPNTSSIYPWLFQRISKELLLHIEELSKWIDWWKVAKRLQSLNFTHQDIQLTVEHLKIMQNTMISLSGALKHYEAHLQH